MPPALELGGRNSLSDSGETLEFSPMSASLNVVCPHCDALNRLPAARLAETEEGVLRQMQVEALSGQSDAARRCRSLRPAYREERRAGAGRFLGALVRAVPDDGAGIRDRGARLEPRRLAKVDTEAVPAVGNRFGIRAIPTMILFIRAANSRANPVRCRPPELSDSPRRTSARQPRRRLLARKVHRAGVGAAEDDADAFIRLRR